eukprot:1153408-Pelagomonas_calceolata.AAC.5
MMGWCHCGSWVGRAKECRLDNFLVRPVQAEQAHRMLAIHVIKALLFAQFLVSQSQLPVSSARSCIPKVAFSTHHYSSCRAQLVGMGTHIQPCATS